MDGIYVKLAVYATELSFVPLLLLQFLPPRLTLTKGAQVNIDASRPIVWSVPIHLLSNYGKALRIVTYVFWFVACVFFLLSFV